MEPFKNTFVAPGVPISEAVRVLEKCVQKICLVVDESQHLLGTITDGDIRRGLLAAITLDAPVERVMNRTPKTAAAADGADRIRATLIEKKLRCMPIVGDSGQIVDLVMLDQLQRPGAIKENWVVLMAGGIGSRLKPLTDDTPKPLLMVGHKPILETIVDTFVEYGFRRFYISINYRAEMIREHFGDGSRWGIEIRYLEEEIRLGTAGPLSLIEERPDEPLVVMNGDLLTKVNFDHLLAYHHEHASPATLCVREYDFQVPYGVVDIVDNHISKIDEKPVQKFFVSAGIHVIESSVIDLLSKDAFYDMPDLFSKMSDQGMPAGVFPVLEYWLDVGQLEDFHKANGDFLEHFVPPEE